MKILKKRFYIALDSKPDLEKDFFRVTITSNLSSLLKNWGATSRISPIWQLRPTIGDAKLIENFKNKDPVSLWFLHGVSADFLRDEFSQENLVKLYDKSMWLSVGAHSLILVCREKQLDEDLGDTCRRCRVSYERWKITKTEQSNSFLGTEIEYVGLDELHQKNETRKSKLAVDTFMNAKNQPDDALGFMQVELCALLSVIEGRSRGPYSVFLDDANGIEQLASQLINGDEEEEDEQDNEPDSGITRPDLLLTLNAGLSRLTSQALSGTSPILRTECHFWPHSFLGTGVANLALRNVASFLTELTDDIKYDQRIYALSERQFNVDGYVISNLGDSFPDFISLEHSQVVKSNNVDALLPETIVPYEEVTGKAATPITFFSGRDGFMNGALTTSAPLPSVLGGNSYQWNLGTITHEISHRIPRRSYFRPCR